MSRKHQKNQMELVFDTGDSGEATRPVSGENELGMAESKSGSPVNTGNMMEEIITRENLRRALKRVKSNKGSTENGVGKGLAAQTAGSSHSIWRISHSQALAIGMNNVFFEKLGLFRPGIR